MTTVARIDRRTMLAALAGAAALLLPGRVVARDGGDDHGGDDHGGDDHGGDDHGGDDGGGNGGGGNGSPGSSSGAAADSGAFGDSGFGGYGPSAAGRTAGGSRRSEQDLARDIVREGRAVPFSAVIPVVRTVAPGKILDVKLIPLKPDQWMYRVLVLQRDGQYQDVRIDAQRNKVIGIRRR